MFVPLGIVAASFPVILFAVLTRACASLIFLICGVSDPTELLLASLFIVFPIPRVASLWSGLSDELLFIPQNSAQALILPKILPSHQSELIPCI